MKPNLHFITGGLGKQISFSALLNPLYEKEKNKLCVQTGFYNVFKNHPLVASQYMHGETFLRNISQEYYKQYNKIFNFEPYHSCFLKGEEHLIDSYAKYYELENYEKLPDYYIDTNLENNLKKDIIKLNKFIIVQFKGGPLGSNFIGRDYEYGQEVVNFLKKKYPYLNIINMAYPEQNNIVGCVRMPNETYEAFMIYAKYCSTFISIDSALMHICSNKHFDKKGVCLWGATSPKMFGYEKNINLISNYPDANEIDPKTIITNIEKIVN